jgi:hypothetical protein
LIELDEPIQPCISVGDALVGAGMQRGVLSFLIVVAIILLALPGTLVVSTALNNGYLGKQLFGWQIGIFDWFLPNLKPLPAQLGALVTAVFPAAVIKVCYSDTSPDNLSATGKLCLVIVLVGAALNALSLLLPDSLLKDHMGLDSLASLRGLSERAAYVTILYALIFLGLKPKS